MSALQINWFYDFVNQTCLEETRLNTVLILQCRPMHTAMEGLNSCQSVIYIRAFLKGQEKENFTCPTGQAA